MVRKRPKSAGGQGCEDDAAEGHDESGRGSAAGSALKKARAGRAGSAEARPLDDPKKGDEDLDEDSQEDMETEDEDEEGSDDEAEAEEAEEEEEGEEDEEGEEAAGGEAGQKRIWRPGVDSIEEGEQLDVEPGTYDMLHRAQVEWPCLSFDIVRDDLGAQRTSYPMTVYVVAGTQAERAADNRIYMMKWSQLYRTSKDGQEDSDEDDSEDSEEEHEAVLESKGVAHPGCVNRIRSMPQASHIVATWADSGHMHMWNLESQRKALDKPSEKTTSSSKPIFTCDAHKQEGFALDFSPHDTGRFLSGGNDAKIFLWDPVAGGWNVGKASPFAAHTAAVEDVQWKRHGSGNQHVFASCGVDRTLRVWDVREKDRTKSVLHVADAHPSDINVLSWSPCVGELVVTGADDGSFKIWDSRNFAVGPMANFQWHRKAITSIDWHPTDETVLAVSADDDSVSLWDMAVEDDSGGGELPPGAEHFPPQLLFLHQGQHEPKEVRWHPQLPSVCICTAGSGFNIFKTCNI